jgi:hypothetical protein
MFSYQLLGGISVMRRAVSWMWCVDIAWFSRHEEEELMAEGVNR